MKAILTTATAAAVAVATLAGTASANEHAIKARQAMMQLYAFNLGQLGAMAKGEVDYNSDAAMAAASNLLAAATMNQSAMWPQGTDNESMPGKTAALPAIWTTFPKIAENGKALVDAATLMAAEAGNGLDAVRANIGAVGGACAACHKAYRAPN